jgi:hypothetical protein
MRPISNSPSAPKLRRPALKNALAGSTAFAALALLSTAACLAQPHAAPPGERCGEVVTIETQGGGMARYAFIPPAQTSPQGAVTLVLLPGGSGHVDLDEKGCARALKGNWLVRSIPVFGAIGFGTALVDAPSDHHGEDSLAGRHEPRIDSRG